MIIFSVGDILEKYISFLLNFNEICKITYSYIQKKYIIKLDGNFIQKAIYIFNIIWRIDYE